MPALGLCPKLWVHSSLWTLGSIPLRTARQCLVLGRLGRSIPMQYDYGRAKHTAQQPEASAVELDPWKTQKKALKNKFGEEKWQPRKRLSPDALDGIRHLHAQDPAQFSTPYLAEMFEVSPEAIRRILKSKWQPSDKEREDRNHRWERRGQSVWERKMALGMKAPKRWRDTKQEREGRAGAESKGRDGASSKISKPEPVRKPSEFSPNRTS